MATLGEFVRGLRRARGVTQAEVQAATGIPQTYLSDIEIGRTRLPSPDHRRRLGRALGSSNVELLVAAGELEEAELEAWARKAGFVHRGPGRAPGPLAAALRELDQEDERSPRVALALRIPAMTRAEAAYLLDSYERLPTEARAMRKKLSPEDYRRWRDAADMADLL